MQMQSSRIFICNPFSLFNYPCFIFPGAIEKQKLVYILNRDAAARLTISSPLEAHKANTLVYHVVGVDVGFENPMFACLEMDYEVSHSGEMIKCMGSQFWPSRSTFLQGLAPALTNSPACFALVIIKTLISLFRCF